MNSKHSRRAAIFRSAAALTWLLVLSAGCGRKPSPDAVEPNSPGGQLHLFVADSLHRSFKALAGAFQKRHPNVKIIQEAQGSVLLTRMAMQRRADVLAVADYRLARRLLYPRHAGWIVKFATNEIVIAYTERSRARTEITADNWYDILLRPDVVYGYSDPSLDPCGYYTLMTWKLAERHYAAKLGGRKLFDEFIRGTDPNYVQKDTQKLLATQEATTRLDYAFVYKSQAEDLRLAYVRLPKEINVGDPTKESWYRSVEIPIGRGQRVETFRGGYAAFGITILKRTRARDLAEKFVSFVLSPEGRRILRANNIAAMPEPEFPEWCRVPAFLKPTGED